VRDGSRAIVCMLVSAFFQVMGSYSLEVVKRMDTTKSENQRLMIY
jgi:hypothetical protein